MLIVEDLDDAASTLAAVLELHGFQARTARTGTEGLTAAGAFRPHVVILDLGLPDADGCTVLARARAAPDPPAVVVVTGYGDDAHRQAALDAGAAAYLIKPADPAEVAGLVGRLCAATHPSAPTGGVSPPRRPVPSP